MKVIYIAGPYRADTPWRVEKNVREAEEVALQVWLAGAIALCPHSMTRFYNGIGTDEMWLEGTKELLRRSDGVILVDGWKYSEGTLGELEEADKLNLPVFDSILENVGEEIGYRLSLERLSSYLKDETSYDIKRAQYRHKWLLEAIAATIKRIKDAEVSVGFSGTRIEDAPQIVKERWNRIREWQNSGDMLAAFETWEEAIEKGHSYPAPLADFVTLDSDNLSPEHNLKRKPD